LLRKAEAGGLRIENGGWKMEDRELKIGDGDRRMESILHSLSSILRQEKEILKLLHQFPSVVVQAGEGYSPATIANYVYELSKEYNQFYQEIPVLKEENKNAKLLRLKLSFFTGNVIRKAMWLLGIEVPERM